MIMEDSFILFKNRALSMNVVRVKRRFIQIKPSKSKATILSGNPERFSDTRIRKPTKWVAILETEEMTAGKSGGHSEVPRRALGQFPTLATSSPQ